MILGIMLHFVEICTVESDEDEDQNIIQSTFSKSESIQYSILGQILQGINTLTGVYSKELTINPKMSSPSPKYSTPRPKPKDCG